MIGFVSVVIPVKTGIQACPREGGGLPVTSMDSGSSLRCARNDRMEVIIYIRTTTISYS